MEREITWYTKMSALITISFPEDKVCCANCRIGCKYEESYKRYTCRFTGDQLIHPHTVGLVGARCPFEIVSEKEEEQ